MLLFVPVIGSGGKPLMPCHPARVRELVRSGRAVRRHDRGLFYIKLTDRADGATQPIAVGIDPGSKKEAFTVKYGRISLHSLRDGRRLCHNAKPDDCVVLTRCSWRAYTVGG